MAKKKDETEEAPGRTVVRMFCADVRKEAGVSVDDGSTVIYKADREGVIEVAGEHVDALSVLGWKVIE